jgi:hypothetical protein
LGIDYFNKAIANVPYTKFLDLVFNDKLTCGNHIDQLISRLNSTCYTITAVKAMLSRKAFRMLYCPYAHSVISCNIMFVVTPLMVLKCWEWENKYWELWLIGRKWIHVEKGLKTGNFTFLSQYIFSFLLYVVNNKHLFTKNLAVHNHDIRSDNNFHLNFTNITKYHKAAHYTGINIFNHLPTHIKCVANEMQIAKLNLNGFLLSNSFCSFEKYFISNK